MISILLAQATGEAAEGAGGGLLEQPWFLPALAAFLVLDLIIAYLFLKKRMAPAGPRIEDPLERIRRGLDKTRGTWQRLKELFNKELDSDIIDDIEEVMITSDMSRFNRSASSARSLSAVVSRNASSPPFF